VLGGVGDKTEVQLSFVCSGIKPDIPTPTGMAVVMFVSGKDTLDPKNHDTQDVPATVEFIDQANNQLYQAAMNLQAFVSEDQTQITYLSMTSM